MGIKIDPEKNDKNEVSISSPDSKVSVFRIPTNEELVIALDTKNIVEQMTKN
jgi:acetate kinase